MNRIKGKALLLEPFYSGSHAYWSNKMSEHSSFEWDFLTLEGRHWKWRMQGGAIALAQNYRPKDYDFILASSMCNLPLFMAQTRKHTGDIPVGLFMHENQLSYPKSLKDTDLTMKRDAHYGFINYQSCLVADHIYFNGHYHLESFLSGLDELLGSLPDYQMRENVELIRSKSTVVPLGLNLNNVAVSKDPSDEPIFLWNHRWEYDKCPEDFLALLSKLAKRDYRFKVVILGQSKLNKSQILKLIPENLKEHILHVAPNSEVEEYRSWLSRSHILFVTAIQDFFGLSVVEGIAHGLYPLLPNRICYPERIPQELHHQYLYHSEEDGLSKLCSILDSGSWRNPNENLLSYCKQYDWSSVGKTYDELWLKLAGKV